RTASATLSCSVTGGLISTDPSTCSATSNFADANTANAKTVNISSVTVSNANYTASPVPTTTTANISPASVTVSVTASNKMYDRTASATLSCSVTGGLISTDTSTCSATGNFADANTANAKTVNINSVTLGNANYYISSVPTTTTANITPRPVTIQADNKSMYYGNPL